MKKLVSHFFIFCFTLGVTSFITGCGKSGKDHCSAVYDKFEECSAGDANALMALQADRTDSVNTCADHYDKASSACQKAVDPYFDCLTSKSCADLQANACSSQQAAAKAACPDL